MSKHLVVLDGYSLLYRAFFATRFLSTSDGRPTNAIYGFVSMLFYILEKDRPDAVAVALDAPGKTFRHAEYSEYKGTRRETPDELRSQLKVSRDLIAALGIPSFEVTGFEADDVVGTIAKHAKSHGYRTTIVTGDLDALQLVDEDVRVMTMKQGVTEVVFYGPQDVINRYGFEAIHVPDYKSIVGDTSDNIPGVPGIGEKGATQLIQQFGTIENMLEHWDEVEPKFQKKIEPAKEQMLQSKWLATINREAPVALTFEDFKLDENEFQAAKAFLELYELRSHVRRMDAVLGKYREGFEASAPKVSVESERIEIDLVELKGYDRIRDWVKDRPFSIQLETVTAQLGMFDDPERVAFIACGQEVRKTPEINGQRLFWEATSQAVLHDAKPFYKHAGSNGKRDTVRFDTMLAGYVLQSGRSNYVLRDLVQGYLEVTPPQSTAEMAAALSLLERPMRERLEKETQTSVLTEIEQPLVPVLAEMEQAGIVVSPEFLKEFSSSLEVEIERLSLAVYEEAQMSFNIGSPKQLGDVLFEKMMIPGPKKTKTGYPTGVEVLQNLAPAFPIIANVLSWREYSKLRSTYAEALPRLIREDGRIHTTFTQTVAATGRLSSHDPNLQNIPIRTELGRKIRKAFIPAEGFQLASFDYSQIELRVLADMCGEDNLIDAFQRKVDVHTVTAALMFNKEGTAVTKEERGLAKTLNYAVLYGVTEYGLANQLNGAFSVGEARKLIEQYRERFPKVKGFTEATVAEARAKGFTTTMCGRRRYFPDIHNANRNERMYAERQAMNAPIQGTASDMIKLAMLKIPAILAGHKSRMLLQVHDELVFELAKGEEHLIEPLREAMESALPLCIPVEVDCGIGPNWDEAK
ncbi:MAG: DNA polymerase I [Fimbriimonadaceae bacterium]